MMKKEKIHIKKLDLGHGVIIENDEIKCSLSEDVMQNDSLDLKESFDELVEMAEKIDKYYQENVI